MIADQKRMTLAVMTAWWAGLFVSQGPAMAELVVNGEFSSGAGSWTPINISGGGWQYTTGWDGTPGWFWLNHDGGLQPEVQQLITGLTPGKEYVVSGYYKTVVFWQSGPSPSFEVRVDDQLRFQGGDTEVPE